MTDTSAQTPASVDSEENNDTATRLIGILIDVIHQCSFNDFDFDDLLSMAVRQHQKQLAAEQIEERSLS